METEIKSLEKICKINGFCFQTNLLGNIYCSLSLGKKINCCYLLQEKDQNDLYPCKLGEEKSEINKIN